MQNDVSSFNRRGAEEEISQQLIAAGWVRITDVVWRAPSRKLIAGTESAWRELYAKQGLLRPQDEPRVSVTREEYPKGSGCILTIITRRAGNDTDQSITLTEEELRAVVAQL